MAAPDLTVLRSPDFPQVLKSAIDRAVDRVLAPELTTCFYEDEDCDCRELATVHSLVDEQEYCLRHFRAVTR